jgi:hypothetical protein
MTGLRARIPGVSAGFRRAEKGPYGARTRPQIDVVSEPRYAPGYAHFVHR